MPSLLEADIHSLSHDGRGISSINGKTTFISQALPDEKVTYRLLRKHTHYDEAERIDILKAANHRIPPVCQHFGVCGGCSLQYMDDELQLQLKEKTLLEQLTLFGKVVPENILKPLQAKSIHYRRKARLGIKFVIKKNKMLIGFREKKSRYLADLSHCKVLHPIIGEQLNLFSEMIGSLQHFNQIPQMEIAVGDDATALVFRNMVDLPNSDLEILTRFGAAHSFHLYLQPNTLPIKKIFPHDNIERLTYHLPEFNLNFLFHPLDFTQINFEINQKMISQALSLLDISANDCVLDLFCGIGNFTLPIAKKAKEVLGIEGSEAMVKRAYENAAHNNMTNVQFRTANLTKDMIEGLENKMFDKILLDPPRTGAKEILPFVLKNLPKKIVYVSCNPATLARDAEIIVHHYAYRLTHAGIMNMFPHTSHTEAMAVFEK